MNRDDLVITIDYGTQSVRVAIIDQKGNFLAIEQEKYKEPYFSPKPGYCEQWPDFYYQCMIKASKRLKEKHQDLLEKCVAISSTCFRDTPVFLDEEIKPIRPSIIWLDQRFAEDKDKLPWYYRAIYKMVGAKKTAEYNRKRTPFNWLKENEPETIKKLKYYAPLNFYLNYKMIGVLTDSGSNAIGHFPIRFKTSKVHSKHNLVGVVYGIDGKYIPKISKIGEVIGKITKKCSEETGLPEGLIYVTTGNDKSCESIGCGCINNKSAHLSYGTASTISITSKKYFSPERLLPSYASAIKGYYNSEVQIYRGYWMVKRFTTEFAQQENVEAQIEHMAVEELMNEKILEIRPGCDGLILQPYRGPGLRRPLAKGCILGFYDTHTKLHIYKAIIEGIAFALEEGLETIKRRGHVKVDYLTVSGGGSKSDAICQITSDIFGLKIYKPDTHETSSLGCAIAIYLSLGYFKNIEEACKQMVRYKKIFYPNEQNHKEYKFLYKKIYKHIYPNLKNIYKELSEYQHKTIQK